MPSHRVAERMTPALEQAYESAAGGGRGRAVVSGVWKRSSRQLQASWQKIRDTDEEAAGVPSLMPPPLTTLGLPGRHPPTHPPTHLT